MKKTLTIIALLAGATGVYAQGEINWGDYVSAFTIDIFSPQNNPSVQQTGQTSFDKPAGATAYQGVPIGGSTGGEVINGISYGNGANFTYALYGAAGADNNAAVFAGGAPVGNPIPGTTGTFQTSGGIGVGNAGINGNDSAGVFSAGTINGNLNPGLGNGAATFMLAAWYNPGGNTYATPQAAAAAGAPYGYSSIETVSQLGNVGTTTIGSLGQNLPNTQPAGDAVISSFSLVEVPEPSTIALGVIGASSFLFRRRK